MPAAKASSVPRPASPPRVQEVPTPMGRWSYAVYGERRRPGDPDILLLHGLFNDSTLWRAQVEPLALLGRVVALDLPGHGRSEVPPPFDLPGHAEALAGALPAMDVRRAVCVGLSWGASLALHLALSHPASVAALGLLGWHIEGPYLSPQRPGAHNPAHLRPRAVPVTDEFGEPVDQTASEEPAAEPSDPDASGAGSSN